MCPMKKLKINKLMIGFAFGPNDANLPSGVRFIRKSKGSWPRWAASVGNVTRVYSYGTIIRDIVSHVKNFAPFI